MMEQIQALSLFKAVYVQDDDTPKTLQERIMHEAEWQILPRAIDMIANGKIAYKKKN